MFNRKKKSTSMDKQVLKKEYLPVNDSLQTVDMMESIVQDEVEFWDNLGLDTFTFFLNYPFDNVLSDAYEFYNSEYFTGSLEPRAFLAEFLRADLSSFLAEEPTTPDSCLSWIAHNSVEHDILLAVSNNPSASQMTQDYLTGYFGPRPLVGEPFDDVTYW